MTLNEALRIDMEKKNIDIALSLSILHDFNSGMYDKTPPLVASGVPTIDNQTVIRLDDVDETHGYRVTTKIAKEKLGELKIKIPASTITSGKNLIFPRAALLEIGEHLLAKTAYGVLNGGSATSYADRKKNIAFDAESFALIEQYFDKLVPVCKDRPKGITPAFLNKNGDFGLSFLLLKARARLVLAQQYKNKYGKLPKQFLPLFQMSSVGTDAELRQAYAEYSESEFLAPLAKETGLAPCDFATGVQPLIAALTHSSDGKPRRIFDHAYGQEDTAIALPGGHGQCLRILAPVLKKMHSEGIRFAYLGNVDNIGYLPNPLEIAILALSGKCASFDFAYRTAMDVKGGILIETKEGKRAVADLGPAISFDEMTRLEAAGESILFNCATGLFDLDYLIPRIDDLARRLPLRVTDQDKDAGRYAQAEQVTWEITSILPSFIAFAVNKYDRFIAAKLLSETILTSAVVPEDKLPPAIRAVSEQLASGLRSLLENSYALKEQDGKWGL